MILITEPLNSPTKMKYKSTLLLLLLLIVSCTNSNNEKNLALDCDSINELLERDQALRNSELKSQFFANVELIMKARGYPGGLDDIGNIDQNLKSEIWDEAHNLVKPYTEKEEQRIDSLWKIQIGIDSLNTLHVIKQIEEFGIDSLNAIDTKCDKNSLVVFVHCPEGLKEKVAEVIENNKDGVGENRYGHISWHLDGRIN